ncbi:actin-like ATPase domain-containing protein, partial [Saccharata proteae CBS 121410]
SAPRGPSIGYHRSTSSTFGAPGSFRSDEEHIILEFGARSLRVGLAGENKPRCSMGFGPEQQRRVGDYRRWVPGYETTSKKRKRGQEWGEEYELWRMDLRNVDLGLVEDKIERALREVVTQYLLLDHRPRRATIAIPPLLPRPLLSTVLSSVFTNLQALNVTLLSSPVLSAVAAGLRSALVIDVGWAETTVTAVYEYREMKQRSTTRAGKLLNRELAEFLNAELAKSRRQSTTANTEEVGFEETEEVLTRFAWCFQRGEAQLFETLLEHSRSGSDPSNPTISIPLPTASPPTTLRIPFSCLARPAESALFAANVPSSDLDDNDQPIPLLAYKVLLSLTIDARKTCMSRIILTGGVSNLPGIKRRILSELDNLVQRRGWDHVRSYGSATAQRERTKREQQRVRSNTVTDTLSPLPALNKPLPPPPTETSPTQEEAPAPAPPSDDGPLPPSQQPQQYDPFVERLEKLAAKHTKPSVDGEVRGIETLGAWSGASIVANMRIKGVVEVERERYLQHGLAGASRDRDFSVMPQNQRHSHVGGKNGPGDRGSWTLGIWA